MLDNTLRREIWDGERSQDWAWNPLGYSHLAGEALYSLLAREFAPLPQRLKAATARMTALPALFAQMRQPSCRRGCRPSMPPPWPSRMAA